MASSVIGALRVNLGINSAQFSRGMTDAQKRLKVARAQFLGFAAAATVAAAALVKFARNGADDLDRVAKSARRLGSSMSGYRALELAAGEAGVSVSTLTDAVQTLDREVARGGKKATEALDRLGLSARDLAGLDADEKIALLADRIVEMGLSTGEASELLQDLGIRNREMILAVIDGGAALREARKDLEDYGLAGERVERMGPIMEKANDQISRMSVIWQYFGQELANVIVPSLGRFAQAMTDSLRAGGLLRRMIDGLVAVIGPVSRAVMSLGVFLAGRFVFAMGAAALGVKGLGFSFVALRAAIIRTGFGVLIVGAGELVYWLARATQKTGSFGTAVGLLKDVAVEAIGRIISAIGAIPLAMQAASDAMNLWFTQALVRMYNSFARFTQDVAEGLNNLFGTDLIGARMSNPVTDPETWAAMGDQSARSSASSAAFSSAMAGLTAPLASMQALRDAVAEVADETDSATKAAADLGDLMDGLGGGGGGSGGAGTALEPLIEDARTLSDVMGDVRDTFKGVFVGLVTGAKSLSEAVTDLISKFAEMLASRAFDMLWGAMFPTAGGAAGGGIGGFFSGLIGSNATGTNNWRGGLTSVNERGGEIMNLPGGTQIIPHDISKRMADGSGTTLEVHIHENATDGQTQVKQSGGRIDVLLRRELSDMVRGGGLDGAIGQRFGMRPRAAGG